MKKFLWILSIILLLGVWFLLLIKNPQSTISQKVLPLIGLERLLTWETTTLANPASVYCEQNSGTIEITTDLSWNQSWLCHLLDGTTCDERAYFRGECPSTVTDLTGTELTGTVETWWLMDQVSQEVNNEQPSKSLVQSTTIKSYENAKNVCWFKDWFYKNEANKINYYSWEIYQPAGVYKKNGFLYFFWRIPNSDNEWTQWIHLYKYGCQDSKINDIYDFWWELYSSVGLNFASDALLYIYEYFWDSCDYLFWNSSIYNIETNSLTRFDFIDFSWFKEKPWCECTKNLDIKNGNEAYSTCYCWNEGSCPEDDQEQYKVKIDILNKKIIDNWW